MQIQPLSISNCQKHKIWKWKPLEINADGAVTLTKNRSNPVRAGVAEDRQLAAELNGRKIQRIQEGNVRLSQEEWLNQVLISDYSSRRMAVKLQRFMRRFS
eukprot:403338611